MTTYPSNSQLPPMLTAEQVGSYLNISRAGAYQLFHTESFPCIRIGKRLLIQREKFLQWIDDQSQGCNSQGYY